MNCLQRKIVSLILRNGSCSRKELSSLCSVTLAAITQNTKPLIKENILDLIPSLEDKVGRKEDIIVLKEDAFFLCGIRKEDSGYLYEEISAHKKIRRSMFFSSFMELDEYISLLSLSNCLGITIVISKSTRDENEDRLIAYLKSKVENVFVLNETSALGYAYKNEILDEENMMVIDASDDIEASVFLNRKLFSSYPNIEIGNIINYQGIKLKDIVSKEQLFFNYSEIISSKEKMNNFVNVFSLIIHNAIIFFRLNRIILFGKIFEIDKVFDLIKEKIDELEKENSKSKLFYRVNKDSFIIKHKAVISALYLSLNK